MQPGLFPEQAGGLRTSGARCRAWLSPDEREIPAIHQPVNAIGQAAGATSTTWTERPAADITRREKLTASSACLVSNVDRLPQ